MKRPVFALCAGILLLGLLPGSTLAASPPSNAVNLDQWANPGSNWYGSTGTAATMTFGQTFTAGKTGMLPEVDLYLQDDSESSSLSVTIEGTTGGLPDDSKVIATSASSTLPTSPAWVPFYFSSPSRAYSVTAGTMYAIVFATSGTQVPNISADAYAGGQSVFKGSGGWTSTSPAADLAFMTFVDTVTTTLAWDKASVTAGTSTPLTLTATMTFANGSEAYMFSVRLGVLPGWFTPGIVSCSPQIDSTGCHLSNLQSGYSDPLAAGGDTVTYSVTGTAAPLSSDIGTPGTATGEGCLDYSPGPTWAGCGEGTASVAVAPYVPAPPTTTCGGTVTFPDQPSGYWLEIAKPGTPEPSIVGDYEVPFSAISLASGSYLYQWYIGDPDNGEVVVGAGGTFSIVSCPPPPTLPPTAPPTLRPTLRPTPAPSATPTAPPATPPTNPPTTAPTASPTPFQTNAGQTATTITPPPTSTGNNGSSNNSTPLLALLACLAFGGLALAAVEAQRRTIRS
jgi:hypothetical protein